MRQLLTARSGAPRLVLRFAVYTAATLAVTATGFLWYVHRYATREAERAVRFHAGFVADTILRHSLRASDFQRPLDASRIRSLDAVLRHEVLVGGALRVKLYAPDGVVRYSSRHDLIGTAPEEPAIANALADRPTFDVTTLDHEGGGGSNKKVLEAYVPVRLSTAGRPVGVFELYQDYAPIAA